MKSEASSVNFLKSKKCYIFSYISCNNCHFKVNLKTLHDSPDLYFFSKYPASKSDPTIIKIEPIVKRTTAVRIALQGTFGCGFSNCNGV